MSQATVTGKVGPGFTLTTQVIQMSEFTIKCDQESLYITRPDGTIVEVDISAQTTITCTVSGNNYTLTVS